MNCPEDGLKYAKVELLGLGIAPVDFFVSMKSYPKRGTKIDGIVGSHLIAGGGPVATALCTFSKLGGGKAALITSFGDDEWGVFARQELQRFGVNHRLCIIRRDCPSALAFAWIDTDTASRTIVLDMNTRLHIKPIDLNLTHLLVPKLIELDGRYPEASIKLARWGKKVGAKVILDIGSVRNAVDDIFPYLDFLVCADQYACHYFRTRSIEKAAAGFIKLGIPEVVVTAGTAGAYGLDKMGNRVRQHAYKVKTVDVTGAGDVYHGAFLFGLKQGWNLPQRMKFAAAAAALKCRYPGARAGIPTYHETMTFIAAATTKGKRVFYA